MGSWDISYFDIICNRRQGLLDIRYQLLPFTLLNVRVQFREVVHHPALRDEEEDLRGLLLVLRLHLHSGGRGGGHPHRK